VQVGRNAAQDSGWGAPLRRLAPLAAEASPSHRGFVLLAILSS